MVSWAPGQEGVKAESTLHTISTVTAVILIFMASPRIIRLRHPAPDRQFFGTVCIVKKNGKPEIFNEVFPSPCPSPTDGERGPGCNGVGLPATVNPSGRPDIQMPCSLSPQWERVGVRGGVSSARNEPPHFPLLCHKCDVRNFLNISSTPLSLPHFAAHIAPATGPT